MIEFLVAKEAYAAKKEKINKYFLLLMEVVHSIVASLVTALRELKLQKVDKELLDLLQSVHPAQTC